MLNLFNQFRAKPPSSSQLGQRLLTNARGVQQKVPVKAPQVSKLFGNASQARGMLVQPSAYGLVGPTSRGLAGAGGFGALSSAGAGSFGATPLFDEFEFDEAWSAADFFGTNRAWVTAVNKQHDVLGIKDPNYGPVPYTPADSSFAAQVGLKWNQLKAASSRDTATRNFMTGVRNAIKGAIAQADAGTKRPWNVLFAGRRTSADEQVRVAAFEAIQEQMENIMAFRVPSSTSTSNTTPGGGIQAENQYIAPNTPTGTNSLADQLGPLINNTMGPRGAAAAPASNTGLYIGGAAAVVAIGVGVFFLTRKK